MHPWREESAVYIFARLLANGVVIYEYRQRFLHCKLALCDDWASVGLSNFDRWGALWNLDANQEIESPVFAAQAEATFGQICQESAVLLHPRDVESLHVVGRHERSSPDMECAAASAHDFQARVSRIGRRGELEGESLVRARKSGNRDGLRVAGARPPDQTDHNLRAGIAGKPSTAFVDLALDQAQSGLLNAAGIGAGQLDARAVLANERPHGVHFDGSFRSYRPERLAEAAEPGRGIPWRRRRLSADNRPGELSITQHLGPHARGRRLHVSAENHRADRVPTFGCIDRDLDVACGSGERLSSLPQYGGACHRSL